MQTRGNSGSNVNYDEIDAIVHDLDSRIKNGFKGSVGIITSFREQQARMEQVLNKSRDISSSTVLSFRNSLKSLIATKSKQDLRNQ